MSDLEAAPTEAEPSMRLPLSNRAMASGSTIRWVDGGSRSSSAERRLNGLYYLAIAQHEASFSNICDQPDSAVGSTSMWHLRFADSERSQHVAGRAIPPEFVVLGREADRIHSLQVGFRLV